jgi:hypothetical protein
LIGTVFGSAANAFADDPFKNRVDIEVGDNTNSCDESGDGNNNADCEIDSTKNIGPIITAP